MSRDNTFENLSSAALARAFALPVDHAKKYKSVAIYGAGETGQAVALLCQEANVAICAFLDDFVTNKTVCGIPVTPIREGLQTYNPDAIILGTITAQDRMSENLASAEFSGRILAIRDPWSYCRSKHHRLLVSPVEDLEPYRDRHKGERAFVMGNGPSLLETDPRRLTNDITFACNNIFLLDGFKPSYYMAIDPALTQDRAQEINSLPWTKFFPSTVSDWITNGHFIHALRHDMPSAFSTDVTRWIEIGFTVTYSMLQLAFFMGCDPIYLIGTDHSYKVDEKQSHRDGSVLTAMEADPNHFHPDYFGPGYRWHDPQFENITAAYTSAKAAYDAHNRHIYNATAGGTLEVFERVTFNDLL